MREVTEHKISGLVGGRYYHHIPKEEAEKLLSTPEMLTVIRAIGYPPSISDGTGAPYIREAMDKMREGGWRVPSWRRYRWGSDRAFFLSIPVIGWMLAFLTWNDHSPLWGVRHPRLNGARVTIHPNSDGYVTEWKVEVRRAMRA